jgi:hypothetical protein
MKIALTFLLVSVVSILSCASTHRARFELNSDVYKDGVRFVEFKTDKVDVAYKILSADEDKVVINVYFTNVSKKIVTVDRSFFYISPAGSKEAIASADPDDLGEGYDESDFFPRAVLKPDDSAGGQIVFSMKNSDGRWVLRNKFTAHTFTFAVKD